MSICVLSEPTKSGVPKGVRTPVTAVKGRCPRPLDDGDADFQIPKGPGGARRDRTADLLHAMQALSQLSYSPTEAGTLRAGHNPVKALGSWYYACEIISLANALISESGTTMMRDYIRPGHAALSTVRSGP